MRTHPSSALVYVDARDRLIKWFLSASRHWRNHPQLPFEAARRLAIGLDQLPLLTSRNSLKAD
ncbi:hypothetical protein [Streptomyces sp. ME19-01-6]|uniref:hypothetical protein n=1 Tax=Streptomyces sp. ME19-01-6 TaxID=3028686 RepID=UPI0029A6AFFC|nr:hypothetical protein [Streptomyces sp. ME19-01-6]MDX3226878.1 hypothetical protein [Streptomyces sp. ME19-01-6]